MKKTILKVAALLIAAFAVAVPFVHGETLVNETGLGYNQTFSRDMSRSDKASFQAVYSSASPAAVTFNDGVRSTNSLTVSGITTFTGVKATDTITVTATANLPAVGASNNITVASNTALTAALLTITTSRAIYLLEGRDWTLTATSTGTAEAIKNAINSNVPGVIATRGGSVVYTTATAGGAIGNGYTVASSTNAALTPAAASFSGGRAPALQNAYFTLNGKVYRNGYEWFEKPTSSQTATTIAALINALTDVDANAVSSVVYATAAVAGTAGNAYTLTSSTSALTVSGATFSNGRDTATVTLNGTVLTNGVDWATGSTSSATAKNISDAIQANTTLAALFASTWSAAGVVTSTAIVSGTAGNVAVSENSSQLSWSGPLYAGGAASLINTTTYSINKANLFGNGMQVLYTKTAGTDPANLTANTTYFVMYTDASNFKLATNAANAKAGTPIAISTQNAAGGGTFILTPLAITGTPSFKWQVSNDNTNWTDYTTTSQGVAVSSVTVTSYTAGGASTIWDFNWFGYLWIRLNVISPTAGGLNLVVTDGKNN
jgi:hypothetical protein